MRGIGCLLFGVWLVVFARPAAAWDINAADAAVLRNALQEGERGNWAAANRLAKNASDPLIRTIVTWSWLRYDEETTSFSDYQRFLSDYPAFPQRSILLRRAELRLIPSDLGEDLEAWFNANPPQTTRGRIYLLTLLDSKKQTDAARALAQDIWINQDFGSDSEDDFLSRFGGYLTQNDHHNRLDHLLWEKQYGQAERMRPLVSSAHWQLAEARRLMQRGDRKADTAYHAVEAKLRGTPGVVYDRIIWRRKRGDDDAAIELMARAPRPNTFAEQWWLERELQARRAQARGNFAVAYEIASEHGQKPTDKNYTEGEFLSGWYALQFNKNASKAEQHFQAMSQAASTPITKARAFYWLSRAARANGKTLLASEALGLAAGHPTTFYGQIASAEMQLPPRIDLVYRSVDAATRFQDNPLARSIRYLQAAGFDKRATPFSIALFEADDSFENLTALTAFLQGQGRPDLALDIAKRAKQTGVNLPDAEFPVLLLPPSVEAPEPALIHAIIRQESMFAPAVQSPVGARGLMQLMPATAKMEARATGLPFAQADLTDDPVYNIRLGSNHLSRLINQYDGYYPMVAAAYNAGPGNVSKWLDTFGDPRGNGAAMLDWIESIPFRETRNYVQRVMEGVEVYRIRLAGIEGFDDSRNVHRNSWCTLSCGLLPADKGARPFAVNSAAGVLKEEAN